MSITDETLAELNAQKAAALAVLARTSDALAVAWARTWDEMVVELREALGALSQTKPSTIARARRARTALGIVSERLDSLSRRAGIRISADARALIQQALADQPALIATQLPPGVGVRFGQPSRRQMEAMARRTTQQIHSATRRMSVQTETRMKRELLRGVAVGENPGVTARRMLGGVEDAYDMSLTRAMTIARTEVLDAYREAAQEAQKASREVLTCWVWVSALSARTCPACIAMHGTEHDLDEPGPIDHHRGRCIRVPKTKSWADLGFDDIDEPEDVLPDKDAWWKGLSRKERLEILGPGRLAAHERGDYPMSAWPERRSTPGWRDSIGTSPVPSRRSLAEAS